MSPDTALVVGLVIFAVATIGSAVRLFRATKETRRRRIVQLVMALIPLLLMVWGRAIEPYWIETTVTPLSWSGPELRVVLLADLHAGRTSRAQIREVVERTNATQPDVVLLAGDFITGIDAPPEKLAFLDELRALAPRLGSFAVLGNHDTEPWASTTPRSSTLTRHLEALGIAVLRNTSRPLLQGVTLVGLGDFDARDTDGPRAFANVPEGSVTIVFAHNPASLREPGVGRFDLALAGHTHGGQICIPLIRYCPFAHEEARPYVSGAYTWPAGGHVYVTRGIGESAIHARFACRPEIAVLELRR